MSNQKETAKQSAIQNIKDETTSLGIELGSTRIKAVLIGEDYSAIATSEYEWENQLIDGVWTYDMDDVWKGLQGCYARLAGRVKNEYGIELTGVGSMGVSGMMHGYLVFDSEQNQLVPFRTWRNTMTEKSAAKLSELFQFNIPLRWSVAHLYQAILNGEDHIKEIHCLTTLAGYVHWKLTNEFVLGVGEASGMFPIDSQNNQYHTHMLEQFDDLVGDSPLDKKLIDMLPGVLSAGEDAGTLTKEGARLLDPSGRLKSGTVFCPPEGDAGTGMVATNSIKERTGNVSAGTSIFSMVVLEKDLSRMYREISMVTTPAGKPVAMVHCNNFSSDLDAWVELFREVTDAFSVQASSDELYEVLYKQAMVADPAGDDMVAYNYYAGEAITQLDEGRPLFARMPNSDLSLPNFMRTLIFSAMGTLKIGMDILTAKEDVQLQHLLGHGGFFKTEGVGQNLMAAAMNVPVAVMESAGEGGAWGIAILAAYRQLKTADETLEDFLEKVFAQEKSKIVDPDPQDVKGFETFMKRYRAGLEVQRAAVDHLK